MMTLAVVNTNFHFNRMVFGAWLISLLILCCFNGLCLLYVFYGCVTVSWKHSCPDSLLTSFQFACWIVQPLTKSLSDTRRHISSVQPGGNAPVHMKGSCYSSLSCLFLSTSSAIMPDLKLFVALHPSSFFSHLPCPDQKGFYHKDSVMPA